MKFHMYWRLSRKHKCLIINYPWFPACLHAGLCSPFLCGKKIENRKNF